MPSLLAHHLGQCFHLQDARSSQESLKPGLAQRVPPGGGFYHHGE